MVGWPEERRWRVRALSMRASVCELVKIKIKVKIMEELQKSEYAG